MTVQSDSTLEDTLDPNVNASLSEGDKLSGQAKKAALQTKCDELLESVADYKTLYDGILVALAESHQQSLISFKDELQRLRDAIAGLEKKSIKRLKVAGTLTAIEKESQRVRVKARLRRRKDLSRMDDFLLDSLRALRALNEKTEHRG
jgi:hypothetical protein